MEQCEACKKRFRPRRVRTRFCPSCQWVIETQTAEQENQLFMVLATTRKELREELIRDFWNWFTCRASGCIWEGNADRVTHDDPRMLVPYVKGWVIADLKHRMRHMFPGRFLPSRRLGKQAWKDSKGFAKERRCQSEFLKRWEAELQGQNLTPLDWQRDCLEIAGAIPNDPHIPLQ